VFLIIPDLLTADEVARLRTLAGETAFVDGKSTNPASQVKHNEQANQNSPQAMEAAQIMQAALHRSDEFDDFAIPRLVAPPLLTRARGGHHYGEHTDAAEIIVGSTRMRTDVSCTIFLSEPETYEGGELVARMGSKTITVKEKPGSAVIYPSNTPHQVMEVTKGERLVGITFIESRCRDPYQRQVLYELSEVYGLEGLNMSWENRSRLEFVQQNLRRMWLQT